MDFCRRKIPFGLEVFSCRTDMFLHRKRKYLGHCGLGKTFAILGFAGHGGFHSIDELLDASVMGISLDALLTM